MEHAASTEPRPLAIATTAAKPPRADVLDSVRVVGASISAAIASAVRRLFGRARSPAWRSLFEITIAATRGSWSVMPAIGMVRWRNVGEALSPLRTDGLAFRMIDLRPDREVPLRAAWIEPPDAGPAVLLYFHGGGYVFGSLRTHGDLIAALARAGRARTLGLEYRLAPEHPSPAALEDALTAYRHLLAEGIDPSRIVLAGDSAGGTLTLITLLAIRDQGLPAPAAAVAISPWVDLGCSGESFETNAAYDFVGKDHCLLAARSYLGGSDPSSPECSPLFADLGGLPPLLVHAGGRETLVDQIRAFVERARSASLDVSYAEYPEMVHVWHLHRKLTPEGQRAIDEIGQFVETRGPRSIVRFAASSSTLSWSRKSFRRSSTRRDRGRHAERERGTPPGSRRPGPRARRRRALGEDRRARSQALTHRVGGRLASNEVER
jgi:monoterpene epsilon-lactone hydrolase